MINTVANCWNRLYCTPEECDRAISELNSEEKRLNTKLTSMRKTKQEYETNVIPHLSEALSQMNGKVETTTKKARELLAENYYGSTPEVTKSRDNFTKSNNSISSAKNKINNLQNIVKANVAHINELISKCNQEKGEVRSLRTRILQNKNALLNAQKE